MSEDSEAQDDELLVLESIYGDLFHSFSKSEETPDENISVDKDLLKGGELKIVIQLPVPFYLSFTNNISGELEKYQIEHLPPIYLNFTFPKMYPSCSPPEYTVSCKWIDRAQLSLLCQRLDSIWHENFGTEIMFMWAQCLKEETLDLLKFRDSVVVPSNRFRRRRSSDRPALASKDQYDKLNRLDDGAKSSVESGGGAASIESILDPRAVQDIGPTTYLLRILREYDEEMRKKVFDSKMFDCKVCFSEKSGSNCIEFWPCYHVYCRDCMGAYFEVQIKGGNIKFLKCPDENCESEANPKQVENLVSIELYEKWDAMLLNSTLSSLGDIQPCPRQHCQYPVTIEDSQGQCPSCAFVFCGLCRFGWHGLEKCKFKSGEAKKILETYMNGSQEEKQTLEDRFGKKYLTVMVEEYLSSTYMTENAKDCPRCKTHIEKIEGCNKMTCQRCNTNFCWLCEKYLDRRNPYSHFNNPNSSCFEMLFHGIEDVEFDDNFMGDDEDGVVFH